MRDPNKWELTEEWRPIPGYEGIYLASNKGLIASVDRIVCGRNIKGRILKNSTSKSDTTKVNLCTGIRSVSTTYTVGYLILITFNGYPTNKNNRACHKDGDHKNNSLDNLFWGIVRGKSKNERLLEAIRG